MKILISAYAFNPLGSHQLHPGEDLLGWKLVEQISRYHDVSVITHSYNRESILEALSKSEIPTMSIHFLELPLGLRKWFYKIEFAQMIYYYLWQIASWIKANKLHRQENFDLFHHLTFGNYWTPSFIGAFLSVPFIWGPVGGGQQSPRRLLKGFSFYGRFAEKTREIGQWLSRNHGLWHLCVQKAKVILVCNKETENKIPMKYRKKGQFFPVNGIEASKVVHSSNGRKKNKPFVVLTAGRMYRLKGFFLGLRAFSIFSKKYTDSEYIIVGKGEEEEKIRSLIERLGLRGKVKIIPWLPRNELLKIMRKSHIFLFPSFRDGGGAVVVEAMASGIPVVCLNAAGPGFHIQEKWGIKVKPRSAELVIEDLAKALEALYLNKEMRIKMGQEARKRALDYYTWDKLGKRLDSIYRQVLNLES